MKTQERGKQRFFTLFRQFWQRLRGGELTPIRGALSIGIGLAIGLTPLFGAHFFLVAAICVPLRLDLPIAYAAANISLPFIAPFLSLAEIQLGARLLSGKWLALDVTTLRQLGFGSLLLELAVGTLVLAPIAGSLSGLVTYATLLRTQKGQQLVPREPS